MDKAQELQHVLAVYGDRLPFDPVAKEPPDFSYRRNGRTVLGVEVSELFSSESHARLRRVDGYSLSLIDGGEFIHRDDPEVLKVAPFELMGPDGTLKGRATGILMELPPFPRRVELLGDLIKRKEVDLAAYAKRWPRVDLVIEDGSSLFAFQEFSHFFGPFSRCVDREMLIRSRFREIFLLTYEKGQRVQLPLRLNLFAEDAFVIESLLVEERQDDSAEDRQHSFRILAHCLSELGYGSLHAVTVDGCIGIVAGAHLYLYTPTGKAIRDYVTIPDEIPKGKPLRKVAGHLESPDAGVARTVLQRRPELGCSVRLCFPVESVTPPGAAE